MTKREEVILTRWERLIFILSVYVILELIISYFIPPPVGIQKSLLIIDTIICFLFLYDFFSGLYKANNKIRYVELHWIDFVGSIPLIGPLRSFRIIKIFRVLRALRSAKVVFRFIYKRNSLNLFNLTLFGLVVIVALSTVSLYYLEKDMLTPNEMIGERLITFTDYLWWSIYTVVGVGYGDALPIAPEGKFISILLILSGIALVGMFTGLVVDYIIKDKEIKKQLDEKQIQMDRLEEKIDQLMKRNNNPNKKE